MLPANLTFFPTLCGIPIIDDGVPPLGAKSGRILFSCFFPTKLLYISVIALVAFLAPPAIPTRPPSKFFSFGKKNVAALPRTPIDDCIVPNARITGAIIARKPRNPRINLEILSLVASLSACHFR